MTKFIVNALSSYDGFDNKQHDVEYCIDIGDCNTHGDT